MHDMELIHMRNYHDHEDSVLCLCIKHDENIFFSGSEDSSIRKWHLEFENLPEEPHIVDQHLDETHVENILDEHNEGITHSLIQMDGHSDGVRTLDISLDGLYLVSGSDDCYIIIWELKTSTLLKILEGHYDAVCSLYVTRNSKFIVSASNDKTIKLWDMDSEKEKLELELPSGITSITGSSDDRFVVGCYENMVRKAIIETDEDGVILYSHEAPVNCLVITPLGDCIITTGKDCKTKIHHLLDNKDIDILFHEKPVEVLTVSNNGENNLRGDFLFMGSSDGVISTYSLKEQIDHKKYTGHGGPVYALKVSLDGKTFFSGSGDKMIGVWDFDTAKNLKMLFGHTNDVRCLAVGKDQKLYSGSVDKTIRIWDVAKSTQIGMLEAHNDVINNLAISYEKKKLFSCSGDFTIKVWNIENLETSKKEEKTLYGHSDTVNDLVLSRDSKFLYTGSADKSMRVWHVDTGRLERIIEGHKNEVKGIRITPDQQIIVSASVDHTVRRWNNELMEDEIIMEGHSLTVNKACLNMTHKLLISCSSDNNIKVWDFEKHTYTLLRTLKSVTSPESHAGPVNWISQSRLDEQILYSVGDDCYLKVWNIHTGDEIGSGFKHNSAILSLTISNNNNYLFIGLADYNIIQYNIKLGMSTPPKTFQLQHSGKINQLNVTKNDQKLVSASDDNTLRVWNINSATCERKLQGHVGAVLSVTSTNKVKNIISGGADKIIKIWDIENGAEKLQLKGHKGGVYALFLTNDDKKLLSGSSDETIRIWRYKTGEQLNIILGHHGIVRNICLDPEGKRIISSSQDTTIRIQALPDSDKELILRGHRDQVNCIIFSKDNKKMFTGSKDRSIRSWDFETGKQEKIFDGHKEAVLSLCLANDNKHLYSSSEDKTIIKWSFDHENNTLPVKVCDFVGHKGKVTSILFDSEEKILISGSDEKTQNIRVWNLADPETYRVFEGHKLGVTCLCLSSDGYYVFSASLDKTIKQWNLETGTAEKLFQGHTDSVRSICCSVEGIYLISGGDDQSVRVWNIELSCEELIFQGHTNVIHGVAIDNESKHIVSCSKDNTIRVWNLNNGQENHIYDGHSNSVMCVAITHDDCQIVSGSKDQTIRIWRLDKYEMYTEIEGHDKAISDLVVTPDNKRVITASLDKTIRVWNVESQYIEERVLIGHKKPVRCLILINNLVYSGSTDQTIKIWDYMAIENNELTPHLEGHHKAVVCLAANSTSQILASGSVDNSIIIWDISNIHKKINKTKRIEEAHEKTVNCLAFCTDDKLLISGSADKFINIWSTDGWMKVKTYSGHTNGVRDLCITSDNTLIISCGEDQTLRVWNLKIDKEEKILFGHEGPISSVILSQDEKHVISGGDDALIKVWNLETGFCEKTLEGHYDGVTSLWACKNGKRIVSGSKDETIKMWWVFDPNISKISLMIELLETQDDDNIIAAMCKEFKDYIFSEFIFPFHFSLFHYYAYKNEKKDAESIERILNILEIQENKQFLLTTDIFNKTPIDVAFQYGNKRILNALLNYAVAKPPRVNCFPNFLQALQKAIEANLPNIEKIFDSRLIPLKQCLPDDEIYQLPEETLISSELDTHAFDTYYVDKEKLQEVGLINEPQDKDVTNRVEFFLLDIPNILDISKKNTLLSDLIDLDTSNLIFSSKALEAILHYKWKTYIWKIYTRDLLLFIIFLALVTVNSVFLFPNRIKESLDIDRKEHFRTASLILNIILIVFTLYFIGFELFQLYRYGKRRYFSSVWHLLDIITLMIVCTTISLDIASIAYSNYPVSWLKALLSINVFLLWIKFLSFARGYKQTAFMVRMIIQVIYDIKVFLGIFFILCIAIGFSMFILEDSDNLDEMNYLAQFKIFNTVYRVILGDNGLFDNLNTMNSYIAFLLWIFFFITTLFMMIIMLNLLISILGDSYDKISGREVLANNYEKTSIIYEIDYTLTDLTKKSLKNKKILEKYLVIVRLNEESVDENQNERIRKKIDRIEEKIDGIEEKFKEIQRKIREKNEVLEIKIEKNHDKLENILDNVQEKICSRLESMEKNFGEKKKNKAL